MSAIVVPVTVATRANNVAINVVANFTNAATNAKNILANGLPANGNQPAITGDDVKAALGSTAVSEIQSLITAVGV